jgi:hypothetical protein
MTTITTTHRKHRRENDGEPTDLLRVLNIGVAVTLNVEVILCQRRHEHQFLRVLRFHRVFAVSEKSSKLLDR